VGLGADLNLAEPLPAKASTPTFLTFYRLKPLLQRFLHFTG